MWQGVTRRGEAYKASKDNPTGAVYSPFVFCEIGGIVLGNGDLGAREVKGKSVYIDPNFIKSISVNRSVPSADSSMSLQQLVNVLMNYGKEANAKGVLTEEEKKSLKTQAEIDKALKEKQDAAAKTRNSAAKNLKDSLDGMAMGAANCLSGAGVTANIEICYAQNLELYRWLYNYTLSQNLTPDIKIRYGIKKRGGGITEERLSSILRGIITKAEIVDWYNIKLSVDFTPAQYLGWDPVLFNKIFKTDPKNPSSNKSNNFKEGETLVSTSETAQRYSDIVRRIAVGLKWEIGEIEETALLPKAEQISVNYLDQGPLAYIINNYCGIRTEKDKNGQSFSAGAVSAKTRQTGYVAYLDDPDNSGTFKFYYRPTFSLIQRRFSDFKVYTYYIMGTNEQRDSGEVIDFSFTPVDINMRFNTIQQNGKGQISAGSINNLSKTPEVYGYQGSINTKKGQMNQSREKPYKSVPQTQGMQLTTDAKGGITLQFNFPYNMTNTWMTATATLKIVYSPGHYINETIAVIVLYPRNDSSRLAINNTADLLHPSSGLYYVTSIQDDISESGATTTLGLQKITWPDLNVTQSEIENDPEKPQNEEKTPDTVKDKEIIDDAK